MKRKLLLFFGVLMLCTGCADSGTNADSTQPNEPFEIDAIEQDDKDEAQEGNSDTQGTEVEGGTKALNLPKFTGDYDVTWVPETDAQPSNFQVFTQNGYYRIENQKFQQGGLLLFTDEEAGYEIPVCSKNGCLHDGEDCEAFFSWEKYPFYSLFYYENKLYVMKREDGYIKIEQIALDGSYRKDSCNLLRVHTMTEEETEDMIVQSNFFPEIMLHRGYVYFSTAYSDCEEAKLCRVPLDSNEKVEVLYEVTGDSVMLNRIKPYGKYVFFQMGYMVDNEGKGLDINIYCYDTEDGTIYQFADGIYRDYIVREEGVYYFDMEQNIWKYDVATGESTLFYENEMDLRPEDYIGDYMFSYGDEIIYEYSSAVLDETTNEYVFTYYQVVLDKDGQIVKRLSSDKDKLLRLNDLW